MRKGSTGSLVGVRKGRKSQRVGGDYARIEFVASPEQKAKWDSAARIMGVSLSAWMVLAADTAVNVQGGT